MKKRFAILLCKLFLNDAEPLPRSRYEEIFTSAGRGKWNMVDYFTDMSHGNVDLSDSKVFGWYQLDQPYTGSGANPSGRLELIDWARKKAEDDGVKLNDFYSVIVVLNSGADLFGGGVGAVAGDDGKNMALSGLGPSFLGQEIGHVFGLAHSRLDGSNTDYTDPFDVMSNQGPSMAPHPIYQERIKATGEPVYTIGPGLNAANMWGRGWLDSSRVWSDTGRGTIGTNIVLRPLHRRDLTGYLCARLGHYFIEFRTSAGWDAAMPTGVLVHRFEDNVSYLVPDSAGNKTFQAGSRLASRPELSVFGSGTSIQVLAIDAAAETATIRLTRSLAKIPREWPKPGPFRNPGVAWLQQNEVAVVIEGRVNSVSPGSVMQDVISFAALAADGNQLPVSAAIRDSIRREALEGIQKIVARELAKVTFPQSPRLLLAKSTRGEEVEVGTRGGVETP